MRLRIRSKERRQKLKLRLRTMESYGMRAGSSKLLSSRPINSEGTDTLEFMRLAELHHKEGAPPVPYERDVVAENCLRVYADVKRDTCQAWLLFENDIAIGYMVAHAHQYYFSRAKYATTEVIFVSKEHRSWKALKMLMDQYEQWADSIDAVQRFTGVARLDDVAAERIQKVFPRLGYKWVGTYYVKEIGQ